jgi:hypothetical protein
MPLSSQVARKFTTSRDERHLCKVKGYLAGLLFYQLSDCFDVFQLNPPTEAQHDHVPFAGEPFDLAGHSRRLLNDGLLRLLTSLPTGIVAKCKRKAIRKSLKRNEKRSDEPAWISRNSRKT